MPFISIISVSIIMMILKFIIVSERLQYDLPLVHYISLSAYTAAVCL